MKKVLLIYSRRAWKEEFLSLDGASEENIDLSKDYYGLRESEGLTVKRQGRDWFFEEPARGTLRQGTECYAGDALENNTMLTYKTIHNEKIIILVQDKEKRLYPYKKYMLLKGKPLTIGAEAGNTVQYQYQNLVSKRHGRIVKEEGRYLLINESPNGIYVNGRRVEKKELQFGDRIHLMGLDLLFLGDVLGIDEVQREDIQIHLPEYYKKNRPFVDGMSAQNDFLVERSPRIFKQIEKRKIKIEGEQEYYQRVKAARDIVFCLSKSRRRKEYEAYLEEKKQEIIRAWKEVKRQREDQFPSLSYAMAHFREEGRLWGQWSQQDGYLTYRIGTCKNSELVSVEAESKIREQMPQEMEMPAVFSLAGKFAIGICGKKQFQWQMMQLLGGQIAANHSYHEVKLAFFMGKEELSKLSFAKWLPHIWGRGGRIRYLATNPGEWERAIRGLQEEVREAERTRWVLFVTEEAKKKGAYWQDALLSSSDNVTLLFFGTEEKMLPYYCQWIYSEEKESVTLDEVDATSLEQFAKELLPLQIKEGAEEKKLPLQVDFFDLLSEKKHLKEQIAVHWKENSVTEKIRVFIGKNHKNAPFFIDFHEGGQGPHGLIGGTTGSGKSELLETMLLSLAFHYSPKEVNFFIIDYKGGGMSQRWSGLPHLVGQISNLSGKKIQRALISIKSENTRRQRLFQRAGVNHIDDYIALCRQNKEWESLSHLFLIVDEFARLKEEAPDFMRELIGLSQIGRSLGIHLLLATQKPAGTIDENIWSNTDFRICLRVQTRGESLEMLQREDAFFLTRSGQGYFQSGKGGIFEKFQCAYLGNPWKEEAEELVLLDHMGQPVMERRKRTDREKEKIQRDILLEAIQSAAKEQKIAKNHTIWMPELPEKIYQEELEQTWKKKPQEVFLGLVDDPANQTQYPLSFDFTRCGNIAVCGFLGTGKSTMIQTMLYGIVATYPAEKVKIYGMDFGMGKMEAFQRAPHVVEILNGDNREKLEQLLEMLKEEIRGRKQQLKGGNYVQYNAMYPGKLPVILVFIDHYGGFSEATEYYCEEDMSFLTKEGVACGIYFIITGNGVGRNDLSRKVADHMNQMISFYFPDKYTYGELFHTGKLEEFPEIDTKGRGIIKEQDRYLLFQGALALKADHDFARMKKIEKKMRDWEHCNDYDDDIRHR